MLNPRRYARIAVLFGIFFGCLMLVACGNVIAPTAPTFDWRQDWAVRKNFAMTIDTVGYQFPTAIAFVPHPGAASKDPLYFVTELRGKVQVVTNDRTVFTFAENFFQLGPVAAYGVKDSLEVGLAGICLDPTHGYVFVTFAYQDQDKLLRNAMVRFQTTPSTFSVSPTTQVAFTDIFVADESHPSHQIGPCQVQDDLLYVNVGDAARARMSQELNTTLGKVLRMTLDGNPVPENPFYQNNDLTRAANFVWTYGLRNPFGLKIVNNQVFVADTGPRIDRFLEIRGGANYLWDGRNRSIGTNSIVVLSPGVGLAQLDYYPGDASRFPSQFGASFFLAVSGTPIQLTDPPPQVLLLEYDLKANLLRSVPKPFVRYRGQVIQVLPALALGPDGLYFAPLMPNKAGLSPVFKVGYDPDHEHPFLLNQERNERVLMRERGCFGCHTLNDNAGGSIGPILDRQVLVSRIEARLNSDEYLQTVRAVDLLDREPFVTYRKARQEVLQAKGLDKVRSWIKYRIQEPKFDNPDSQMPNLGISEEDAIVIANGLVKVKGVLSQVQDLVPRRRRGVLVLGFLAGFSIGGVIFIVSYVLLGKLQTRAKTAA